MNDEFDPTRPFKPTEPDSDIDWEDDEGSPTLLWGRVLALAGVLLLAFLLGRASAPEGSTNELTELRAELADAEDQIAALQDATAAPADPVPTITATPTDEPGGEDPTPTLTPTADPAIEGKIKAYTVKDGDTYSSISEEFFNSPEGADCLVEANGGNEVLSVGATIDVPIEACDPDA